MLTTKNIHRKIRKLKPKTGRQHGLFLLGPILLIQKVVDVVENRDEPKGRNQK